jgi:hypothetical protein
MGVGGPGTLIAPGERRMKNRRWLWVTAIVITLASAIYQRMSGPTYPVRGSVTLGGQDMALRLTRTHPGAGDQPVVLTVPDAAIAGEVKWRRYPTDDPWQTMPLVRSGDTLTAALPHQPVAGKLEYQVRLVRAAGSGESAVFPERPAITRFRNEVPAGVLIPHVLAMFLSMLFSTAAGLSALGRWPQARREAYTSLGLLLIGGFVLGPLMQWYGFGEWWTGVPFGWDLTDNKTLVAAVAWLWAAWQMRGGRPARTAIAAAAVITLVVFLIPHSAWGSELKWDSPPSGASSG